MYVQWNHCDSKVVGGWGHMLATYLVRQLLGPSGLASAGVPIELNGVPTLIFARLENLLTDGDGHRMSYDWKGASSLKPCVKHFNVYMKARVATTIRRTLKLSSIPNIDCHWCFTKRLSRCCSSGLAAGAQAAMPLHSNV